jgi:hypothetical protein
MHVEIRQTTYDAVVCIGQLMFFDCSAAFRQLQALQDHVRPAIARKPDNARTDS